MSHFLAEGQSAAGPALGRARARAAALAEGQSAAGPLPWPKAKARRMMSSRCRDDARALRAAAAWPKAKALPCMRMAEGQSAAGPLPWPKAKARRMTPLQQQKKREAALAEGQVCLG